jgi:capsular polysaccharide biosynthesis protein
VLEQEHGFETVVMSQLPLEQQIRTFREASIIVGAHGAAFAHLAFAPRGAAVLELFQDGHFNNCYGRMAAARGLRYGFLVCDRKGLGLRVDLPALRSVVDRTVLDTERAGGLTAI